MITVPKFPAVTPWTTAKTAIVTTYSVEHVAPTTSPHDGAEPSRDLPGSGRACPHLHRGHCTGRIRGRQGAALTARTRAKSRLRRGIAPTVGEFGYPLRTP